MPLSALSQCCYHGGKVFVLSAAHTEEDIDKTIDAFGDSHDAMIKEIVEYLTKEGIEPRLKARG